MLRVFIPKAMLLRKDVFLLRGNRFIVEMHDISELDTSGWPEGIGVRQQEKIPGLPLVMVPVDLVSIGIDNVGLTDIMVAINLQDNLQVGPDTKGDIESYLAPTKIELFVEVVGPGKRHAEVGVHGYGVGFGCLHFDG